MIRNICYQLIQKMKMKELKILHILKKCDCGFKWPWIQHFIYLFIYFRKKENTRESACLSVQQSFLGAIKNFVEEKLSLRNTSGSVVMVWPFWTFPRFSERNLMNRRTSVDLMDPRGWCSSWWPSQEKELFSSRFNSSLSEALMVN